MGSTIQEEIIRSKIPIQLSYLIILLIFISTTTMLIIFTYDYVDYYNNKGIIQKINKNYYIKVKIEHKDINILKKNNIIIIDNKKYNYRVSIIDNKLSISNNHNYQCIYLSINLDDKYKIDNYIVDFKVEKEKKKIYKYFIELLGGI